MVHGYICSTIIFLSPYGSILSSLFLMGWPCRSCNLQWSCLGDAVGSWIAVLGAVTLSFSFRYLSPLIVLPHYPTVSPGVVPVVLWSWWRRMIVYQKQWYYLGEEMKRSEKLEHFTSRQLPPFLVTSPSDDPLDSNCCSGWIRFDIIDFLTLFDKYFSSDFVFSGTSHSLLHSNNSSFPTRTSQQPRMRR